jgi:hypothetical protein
MKRVEIIWMDIVHESGWHTQEELDDFLNEAGMTVNQLAYLYEEDDENYILVDSYFEDKSQYGTIHVIPKGCVKKLNYL